jgi:hypothetical protein
MARLKALESLLLKMFSAEELRRLIRYLPEGDTLSGALPGLHASPVMVAEAVVGVLDRDGALNEATVWDRFYEARPRRRAEIDVVRAMFPPEPQPAKASSGVLPAASLPAPDKPKVLTILFASASPAEKDRMRVDKEFRRIVEKLRGSRHRDRLRVVTITAVRFEDLRTGLMEHEPHILHISCHGNPDGSLAFEASDGDAAQVVPKKNLLRLLRALGSTLRIVVFNACHSAAIAVDIPPTVGLSIGMSDEILDTESVEFSIAFYEALAFGRTVETAFEAALAGLDEEDEVPRLFPASDADAAQLRKQPLITGDT